MPSTSSARVPGQSLMELAVILPLLLVMLMAVADYALAFTAQTRLRNAVAEGGYVAAQNPGNAALVRDRIRSVVSDLSPPVTDADIAITPCVATGSNNFETVITLSYARPMLFGLFGAGPAVTLTNSTTVPQFGGCR
jgi:Flp pilus assembly protein TadG